MTLIIFYKMNTGPHFEEIKTSLKSAYKMMHRSINVPAVSFINNILNISNEQFMCSIYAYIVVYVGRSSLLMINNLSLNSRGDSNTNPQHCTYCRLEIKVLVTRKTSLNLDL